MQVTDRDLRILKLVADFRYMTREQIERLEFTPTTASYCKRRLSLLYHNAYLQRQPLPLRQAFGAARAYYTLDTRGALLLAEIAGLSRREVDWRPRDGRREALYMEHTLRINDVRAITMLAAKAGAMTVDWTDERDLKRRAPEFRVEDPLHAGAMITVIPDGYFTLARRWSFALELDRGTVEEVPFKRKVRGYGAWKASGRYEASFGTASLRVLFVVADARRDQHRLERIVRWTEAANGASMFWFGSLDAIAPATMFVEPRWVVAGRQGIKAILNQW